MTTVTWGLGEEQQSDVWGGVNSSVDEHGQFGGQLIIGEDPKEMHLSPYIGGPSVRMSSTGDHVRQPMRPTWGPNNIE